MHYVVHDDEPASSRRVLAVGEPRVEEHSHVVVPGKREKKGSDIQFQFLIQS